MSSRLLARGLVRTGCACATLTLVLGGCTTAANTGTSISGGTLSIYVSVPPGPLTREDQDVLAAEQLAFNQAGGKVGGFKLRLLHYKGRKLSDTARQAIGDATTIAYLGEIRPGDSADTLGITNAQDVLQVSPTDTAVELTHSTPVIPNTPDRYYESLATNGRTFARMVPTDAAEAAAVVSKMQALGVKHVYVATDGSEYGRALREAFVSRVGSAISVAASDAAVDAVFYAGSSATGAASVFAGAASSNPKADLFAPSALAEDSFAASLTPAEQRQLYVSSPGFTSGAIPATDFVSTFRSAYGRAPSTQAVFGFAAMQAVLHALEQAGGSASNRKTVVHDFFAIHNFGTAVGEISITKDGDISFNGSAPIVFSRVKSGKLVPVKAG